MRKFIVHNTERTILKFGMCQNKDVALQAEVGQHIRIVNEIGPNFDLKHRIIKGRFGVNVLKNIASQETVASVQFVNEFTTLEKL